MEFEDDERGCHNESSPITPFKEDNTNLLLETVEEKEEDRYSTDDLKDYVTRTEDHDIDVDDNGLEFDIAFPTTNAGEVPMVISNEEKEISYMTTYMLVVMLYWTNVVRY